MARVAEHVYRFSPTSSSLDEGGGGHCPDERITVEDYVRMMPFYREMLLATAGG